MKPSITYVYEKPSEAYASLAFSASRGVPQSVSYDADGKRFRIVLLATVSDIPALQQTPRTDVIWDGGALATNRLTEVPASPQARLKVVAPSTLAALVATPRLAVFDSDTLLGCRPVIVGAPMVFATNDDHGALVEVMVETLTLTAGSLVQPGDFGSSMSLGIRTLTAGVERFETTATEESDAETIFSGLM